MINNNGTSCCPNHPNVDASSYCKKCENYMCAECKDIHDNLFSRRHESFITLLDKSEHFRPHINRCKIHTEYPLDTICNDCCCLCCIRCKIDGEHKTHNTMFLSDSGAELKASLESIIVSLKGYQNALEQKTLEAKEIQNEIERKKDEGEKLIREHFAILREAIDQKEMETIRYLEGNEIGQEIVDKTIQDSQDLMHEIVSNIGEVKTLLSEWDSNKKPTLGIAEKVLSIKKETENKKETIAKIGTQKDCEIFVDTEKFVNGVKRKLEELKEVSEIPMKRVLYSAPTGFMANKVYSVYVTLYWGKGGRFDEYIISYREEGGKWSDNNELIHVDKKNDHCVVHPLKPETKYEFRLMGKIGEMETRWTETVSVKTEARFADLTIDSIVQELRINLDNVDNVDECIEILSNIASSTEGNEEWGKAVGEAGAIEVILFAMGVHANNVDVCKNGCIALLNITENDDNQVIAGECGAINVILNTVKTHINDVDICKNGCGTLWNIVLNNDNQVKASECGTIDVILDVIKAHINDVGTCEKGCGTLKNIAEGNRYIQKEICEKGGLTVLLEILEKYNDNSDNINFLGSCCAAIGTILSSQETHSTFCTQDVLVAVEKCCKMHGDSEQIEQFFLELIREEDQKVKDAVSRGVCTKNEFPKCGDSCGCDDGYYCPECCVRQKAFRCHTCNNGKDALKLYCETCWKEHHQGHECEEFFCSARCATK